MFDYSSIDLRSLSAASGVMAAGLASDSEIFHFRWTHATQRAVIPYVRFSAGNNGTAFAAGTAQFSLAHVTGWSANGTGGATPTVSGNEGKLDVNINAQNNPLIRVASTAALGAGTKTIVANHSARTVGVEAVAGRHLINDDLYSDVSVAGRPIILNQNEGFIIRAIVPATGTWAFAVQVVWGVV